MPKQISALLGILASFAFTAPAQALPLGFNLQLVTLCEGSATCNPPGIDAGYLQSIYTQIDINVNILSTIIDNELILERNGDGEILPTTLTNGRLDGGALFQFTNSFFNSAGAFRFFDIDPNTVYMGFTGDLLDPTNGIAFVDLPSAPFGIVENISGLQGGSDAAIERFTTAILAHEIGHVLGGTHVAASHSTNLMLEEIGLGSFSNANFIPDFSAANAAEITSSALLFASPVTTVPLPATLPALLGGLLLMAGFRWRGRTA